MAVTGGNDAPADSNSDAIFGLTEAVKALAKDVSGKLVSFGRRLEALKSQSAAPEVPDAETSSNTSCAGGAVTGI